jgi:hypothetical protein
MWRSGDGVTVAVCSRSRSRGARRRVDHKRDEESPDQKAFASTKPARSAALSLLMRVAASD